MITFLKTGLTEDVLRLIKKLPTSYVHSSIVLDIEKKFLSVIEVKEDSKLLGIIIARGEVNRRGELVFILQHVVSEDNLDKHFSSYIDENIENWLLSLKSSPDSGSKSIFKKIRQCSDHPVLSRILRMFYGEPVQEVFEKYIGSKDKNEIRLNRQTPSTVTH